MRLLSGRATRRLHTMAKVYGYRAPMTESSNEPPVNQDRPSPKSFVHENWPWLFIAAVLAWALWGSWRVVDLAVDHIQPVGQLAENVRQTIPDASWPIKIVFGIVFVALTLFWVALPAWLFMFINSVMDKRQGESLPQRTVSASKEIAGNLAGLMCLLLFWLCGTLFLAFFGGLLDLIGGLIILGWIAYTIVSQVRRSTTR